jgi:hypothetical protein
LRPKLAPERIDTMYAVENYRTKGAFKAAVASGTPVPVYQPGGFFEAKTDGRITVEGPHYPEPHRWYAAATIADGIIVKGSVK